MSNPFQTEGVRLGDVLKWEVNPNYTREKVTLEANAGATAAPVVGELLEPSSSKKKIVASGGNCDCVLLEEVELADHKAGDLSVMVLKRGPAIIDTDRVTVASNQKTAALAALLVLGIKATTEPTKYTEGTDS